MFNAVIIHSLAAFVKVVLFLSSVVEHSTSYAVVVLCCHSLALASSLVSQCIKSYSLWLRSLPRWPTETDWGMCFQMTVTGLPVSHLDWCLLSIQVVPKSLVTGRDQELVPGFHNDSSFQLGSWLLRWLSWDVSGPNLCLCTWQHPGPHLSWHAWI